MISRRALSRFGFTLVELAIVLGVAGFLFTGLWRLLSNGNQQLKDSAAASQQTQLISAVKSFLASPEGKQFMGTSSPLAVGANMLLPLPTAANPAGSAGCATDTQFTTPGIPATQAQVWCNTMPSGLSMGTINSYGQGNVRIRIRAESATTVAGQAPSTYSFMMITQRGDTISDASGGRISSQIGSDGGFIYTSPTCPSGGALAGYACGAYGAWSIDPTATYGYAAGSVVAGHIASMTYVSPDQAANLPWLARQPIPGDVNATYNTLAAGTNLYLNASGVFGPLSAPGAAQNTLFGTNPLTGGGSYGGAIVNLNKIELGNNDTVNAAAAEQAPLTINGPKDSLGNPCASQEYDNVLQEFVFNDPTFGIVNCHAALQVNGNQNNNGMIVANSLWASNFIYGTIASDRRLKKDITPLTSELDKIMQLQPVVFRFKKTNEKQLGFIAQDLRKIYPDLVVGRPDNVLGINYMEMFAPLVRSIQELKQQNDELKAQIDLQRDQIHLLQDQMKDRE